MIDQSYQRDGEAIKPSRLCIEGRCFVRSIIIVLILAGVLITAGCGSRPDSLSRIQTAGVIRVATDPSFPPFEFVNDDGQIAGFDADLARALAGHLGVEAHFVTTGYDALYDALTVGRADVIISALYPDPSRSSAFRFSSPYFNAGEVLVVPRTSEITAPEDVAGKTVICVFGTEGHMTALRWETTLSPPATLLTVDDPVTITRRLEQGEAQAVLVDHVSAQAALGREPDLRIVTPPVTDEPYVVAVRREDDDLAEAIDAALAELGADGTLEGMIQRWLRQPVEREH
jgi:polar amino acid transport system substrate-binding protein